MIGRGPERPANPPSTPPPSPIAASAKRPPQASLGWRRPSSMKAEKPSSRTPMPRRKATGSSRVTSRVPSGTPAKPAASIGQTRRASMACHTVRMVWACDTTEQSTTRVAATAGSRTCSQKPRATRPVPNPASPDMKPPRRAPARTTRIVAVSTLRSAPRQHARRDRAYAAGRACAPGHETRRRACPGTRQGVRRGCARPRGIARPAWRQPPRRPRR